MTLTRGKERCDLYFSEGQIGHATHGELKGDPAVFRVISWTEGDFQIDFRVTTAQEQSTTLSTQTLLMEGLRLLDEANRGAEEAAGESRLAQEEAKTQPATNAAHSGLTLDERDDDILEA